MLPIAKYTASTGRINAMFGSSHFRKVVWDLQWHFRDVRLHPWFHSRILFTIFWLKGLLLEKHNSFQSAPLGKWTSQTSTFISHFAPRDN